MNASTRSLLDEARVLVVAGITTGAVVAGLGSRLAMYVLRLTSPESVRGVTSDDGFTIGRVTLSGTYSLLVVGAAVGLIGAGAYRLVAPWLLGPVWFRRLTTGLGSAAVVGGMLVHPDGVDFRLLKPMWLAIGLFVLLPGLFGIAIGPVLDAVKAPTSWTRKGRRAWLLPVALLASFPMLAPLLAVEVAVAAIMLQAAHQAQVQSIGTKPSYRFAVRAVWLGIATLGLGGLVGDINALT